MIKTSLLGSISVDCDKDNRYDLSTAWNVSTASFINSTLINLQCPQANKILFSADGTKLFVAEGSNPDRVNEFNCASPWVPSSTFVQSLDVSTETSTIKGIDFNNDGTKIFVAGRNDNHIHEYSLT